MTSLIKNQILKHLSKFMKNMSSDKISLSTLRGEGELTNLELNEVVLTEILELPSWMRLTRAWCNRVTIRIPWTKLKSVPIFLCLDEVHVSVETCEELRSVTGTFNLSSYAGGGKYGFSEKVIDGMTVTVNSVVVTFKSHAFEASVQLSRIRLESLSPLWRKVELRMTRLKEPDLGELLIFKELEWQTLRVEAKSTQDAHLTPLRLITNQARCRITIKKRLSDCSVIGCQLALIMDDLLWVLTDSQLKAALHFLGSLTGLIQQATELSQKVKAARKLETLPEYKAQLSQQMHAQKQKSAAARVFARYDVIETSYHFYSDRIDLHFCDDPGEGRSSHPELLDGGAFQVTLQKLQVDYYPYHLSSRDRGHWLRYKTGPHVQWINQSFNSFRTVLLDLIHGAKTHHVPLNRAAPHTAGGSNAVGKTGTSSSTSQQTEPKKQSDSQGTSPMKMLVLSQLAKLMSSCLVLRIEHYSLYRVTTSRRKQTPREFITGDKEHFPVPESQSSLHAEFTWYYYPGDDNFPLPPPKLYVQQNPVQVFLDTCTILWLNSFILSLQKSLDTGQTMESPVEVKIEVIMPRLIYENLREYPGQKDRPKSLHLQVSRLLVTNFRSHETGSRADLAKCMEAFQQGDLFFGSGFPSSSADYHVVVERFLKHITGEDNVRSPPVLPTSCVNELQRALKKDLLWIEAKDVWYIHMDPVWGDFFGVSATRNRPVAFLDAFPLTLWVYLNHPNEEAQAAMHVLAHVPSLLSIQMNHYQYLFLLRMLEGLGEMSAFISKDSTRIRGSSEASSLCLGAVVPQVDLNLIVPTQVPGKESPGGEGDLESIMPDSSELTDVPDGESMHCRRGSGGGRNGGGREAGSSLGGLPESFSDQSLRKDLNVLRESSLDKSSSDQGIRGDFPSEAPASNGAASVISASFPDISGISPGKNSETHLGENLNVHWKSMKKGFSNIMSSIDSALLKPNADDFSDTVSVRSEDSSDSEKFVMLSMEDKHESHLDAVLDVGAKHAVAAENVEVASEVIEDSPSEEQSVPSSFRRQDLISVVTFHLGMIEFVQQSCGHNAAIKLQCSNFSCDQCSAISWDEFQAKFTSRSRGWNEEAVGGPNNNAVRLRLEQGLEGDLELRGQDWVNLVDNPGPSMLRDVLLESQTLSLQLWCKDLFLQMHMSSLQALIDLIEDEIIPRPLPMTVTLENVCVHLIEDRPSSSITSPGPIPVDVAIQYLLITRDDSGVFQIQAGSAGKDSSEVARKNPESGDSTTSNGPDRTRSLELENRILRRKAAVVEELRKENEDLQRKLMELENLKRVLNESQAQVGHLSEEKKSLLATLHYLQDRLDGGGCCDGKM